MNLSLAIAVVCYVLLNSAEARLGETKEQVIDRYGQPIKELVEAPWDLSLVCLSGGYKFSFFIFRGHVEAMIVEKENLSGDEVNIFLQKNSTGTGFKEVEDKLEITIYTEEERIGMWDKTKNQLTLMTKTGFNIGETARKQKIKEKMETF